MTRERGRLFVLAPPLGSERAELLHAEGGDFFTQTSPLTFRFADDRQSLILLGGRDKLTLTRVKP